MVRLFLFKVSLKYELILERVESSRYQKTSDMDKMDIVSKNLESFGVKRDQTWRILYNYAQQHKSYELPINQSNFLHWIKLEYEQILKENKNVGDNSREKLLCRYVTC